MHLLNVIFINGLIAIRSKRQSNNSIILPQEVFMISEILSDINKHLQYTFMLANTNPEIGCTFSLKVKESRGTINKYEIFYDRALLKLDKIWIPCSPIFVVFAYH